MVFGERKITMAQLTGGHDAEGKPLERQLVEFEVLFREHGDYLVFEWEDNREFLIKKSDVMWLAEFVDTLTV